MKTYMRDWRDPYLQSSGEPPVRIFKYRGMGWELAPDGECITYKGIALTYDGEEIRLISGVNDPHGRFETSGVHVPIEVEHDGEKET